MRTHTTGVCITLRLGTPSDISVRLKTVATMHSRTGCCTFIASQLDLHRRKYEAFSPKSISLIKTCSPSKKQRTSRLNQKQPIPPHSNANAHLCMHAHARPPLPSEGMKHKRTHNCATDVDSLRELQTSYELFLLKTLRFSAAMAANCVHTFEQNSGKSQHQQRRLRHTIPLDAHMQTALPHSAC